MGGKRMRTTAGVLAGALLCSTPHGLGRTEGLQRITTERLYEVRAGALEGLPTIEVGKGEQILGAGGVAGLIHADASDVTLVGTGFAVDTAPTLESGGGGYTARFCSLEHGKVKPELEQRLPAAGGRFVFGRSWAGKNYVLVINDFLAPEALDIVGLQEALNAEGAGSQGEEAGPVARAFFECSRP